MIFNNGEMVEMKLILDLKTFLPQRRRGAEKSSLLSYFFSAPSRLCGSFLDFDLTSFMDCERRIHRYSV
jgi:hypothetical protein